MLTAAQRTRLDGLTPVEGLGTMLDRTKNVLKLSYDFAVQGGAVGSIPLYDVSGKTVQLPNKAIITGGYIDIITAMASAGNAGTIALGVNTGVDLKAAVDADTLAGIVALIPVGTAATAVKLTAARTPVAAIAVEALTAGKFNLFLEYVLSD